VAAELLDLADSALATRDGDRTAVRITHDALADSVGSVRETVTKVIGELSRAGAVDAGYGRVVVRDRQRLRDLANG
jgi:CRP-like cAMP-binding protein